MPISAFYFLYFNFLFLGSSSIENAALVRTCHSCKYKAHDVWGLLHHVFEAHALRVSEENLPNFEFPTSSVIQATGQRSPLLQRPQPNNPSTPIRSASTSKSKRITSLQVSKIFMCPLKIILNIIEISYNPLKFFSPL